jgi:hypothetical protein
MATTKRYRSKPPTNFDSPLLVNKVLNAGYAACRRWFENVSGSVLEDFALKYGTKHWNVSPTGNDRAIVVSYPRANGDVRMYDLDSGDMFWTKVTRLTKNRISGRASERDYEYETVVMDSFRCESEDIQMNIDWESLREFDENPKKMGRMMGGEKVKKLITLPKKVQAKKE